MGEAKRRKQIMAAAGFELRRAYNTELRRMETARVLPMTARQTTNANFADRQRVLRGDLGASVAVPCAGCSACCWAKYIEVEPELERPEDLAVLNVAPNPDKGGFMLAKRPDGACGHLDAERGCTVYEHRPRACRLYDCRLFAITGVADRFDDEHVSPIWVFAKAPPDEAAVTDKLRRAGLDYFNKQSVCTAREAYDYARRQVLGEDHDGQP